MDVELDQEHKMLRDMVREFVTKELMPLERQVGDEGLPPDVCAELSKKTKDLGLWLLDVPAELGGAGLDMLARIIVTEEVSKTTAIRPRRRGIFGPDVSPVLYECNEAQREKYLYPVIRGERHSCIGITETEAGTDPGSMRTTAIRSGDHYVINGAKHFVTHSHESDFIILVALTDPQKRQRGGISCFLVDLETPGVSLGRQWPMMMGDAPGDLYFEDVHVPAENLIGQEGRGFVQAQRFLTGARVANHAARCLGIAQRALDMAIDYSIQRVTFGQPLSERQGIQFMIADSALEIHSARLVLYDCGRRFDQGADIRNESYMAKVMAAETCDRVVDRSMQIHGGMGLTKDLPLEVWYREARMVRIAEGAMEILRWRLARNLIRERQGYRGGGNAD